MMLRGFHQLARRTMSNFEDASTSQLDADDNCPELDADDAFQFDAAPTIPLNLTPRMPAGSPFDADEKFQFNADNSPLFGTSNTSQFDRDNASHSTPMMPLI